MVLSQLVFFDTKRNSKLGTERALISFIPLVFIFSVISLVIGKDVPIWRKICGVLLLALVLCSAIGVQLPKDYSSAILYGSLVGFMVGASILGLALATNETPPKLALWSMSIIFIPLIMGLMAVLTFSLSTHWDLYP